MQYNYLDDNGQNGYGNGGFWDEITPYDLNADMTGQRSYSRAADSPAAKALINLGLALASAPLPLLGILQTAQQAHTRSGVQAPPVPPPSPSPATTTGSSSPTSGEIAPGQLQCPTPPTTSQPHSTTGQSGSSGSASNVAAPDPNVAAAKQAMLDYLSALRYQDSVPPPTPRKPTLGTRDLAWAIPALLGVLSGQNGQQFAAGLIAGGTQANKARVDAANQQALAKWQYEQQQRENDTRAAAQRMQFAENPFTSGSTAPASAASFGGAGGGLVPAGPSGGKQSRAPDFYGRYPADKIDAANAAIASAVGWKSGSPTPAQAEDMRNLKQEVAGFPVELQGKVAGMLQPFLHDNPAERTEDQWQRIQDAYDLVLNQYVQRLNDPFNRYPLTPYETDTYNALLAKHRKLQKIIDSFPDSDSPSTPAKNR